MYMKTLKMRTQVQGSGHTPEKAAEQEHEKHPIPQLIEQGDIEVCHQVSQTSSVTLSGPTLLFILSSTAIFAIRMILRISLAASLLAFIPLAYFIHHDYKSFLSLGPGGTPSTFPGYLKITYLRLYALSDPFISPPPSAEPTQPVTGYFAHTHTSLPRRTGSRPTVEGIAPQRQTDSFPPLSIYLRLRRSWLINANTHPSLLSTQTSCFEKQGLALFAREPRRINVTCSGEIAHIHAIDGSLHVSLHPSDLKELLEAGWGQRHPLAGRGPGVVFGRLGNTVWGKRLRGWARMVGWRGRDGEGRAIVPRGFALVYAPRNEGELEVIRQIVQAGAWWVTGREVELESVRMDVGNVDLETLKLEAGVRDEDGVPGYSVEL